MWTSWYHDHHHDMSLFAVTKKKTGDGHFPVIQGQNNPPSIIRRTPNEKKGTKNHICIFKAKHLGNRIRGDRAPKTPPRSKYQKRCTLTFAYLASKCPHAMYHEVNLWFKWKWKWKYHGTNLPHISYMCACDGPKQRRWLCCKIRNKMRNEENENNHKFEKMFLRKSPGAIRPNLPYFWIAITSHRKEYWVYQILIFKFWVIDQARAARIVAVLQPGCEEMEREWGNEEEM